MNDDQFSRYSRHIVLPEIGGAGQRRLLESRVLIIGMGGLGSPIAMYLSASGVGHIVIADYDHVELSNLQRQVIHTGADIGRHKVESARDSILALNADVEVTALPYELDGEDLHREVEAADVVVDATDNFESRHRLNRACVRTKTPLVSGAAIRMEAQVSVFQAAVADSPCYRCLYAETSDEGDACSQVGVLSPMLGIIGSIQATETLKLLLGIGETLTGRVLVLDALTMEWRTLKLRKDPHCPVCSVVETAGH